MQLKATIADRVQARICLWLTEALPKAQKGPRRDPGSPKMRSGSSWTDFQSAPQGDLLLKIAEK